MMTQNQMINQTNKYLKELQQQIECFPRFRLSSQDNFGNYLSTNFHWGCNQLSKESLQFNENDKIYQLSYQNQKNACMSIKYGIMSFGWAKMKNIEKDLREYKRKHFIAIARVNKVELKKSFKYWMPLYQSQQNFKGILQVKFVTLGCVKQINTMTYNQIDKKMRENLFPYQWFYDADEFQMKQREEQLKLEKQKRLQR